MHLGIFAKTFARPSLEEVLDAAQALGVTALQFNFACTGLPSLPDAIDPSLPERIRTAARDRGLTLAAVSGTFNMIHPDPARRDRDLARFRMLARATAEMGSSLVTLCTGTRDPQDMWRTHPDNSSPEAWRDLLLAFEKVLSVAESHHLFLGVEPELGNVISSAQLARRLLDEMRSPRLKIVMDAANLIPPGQAAHQRERIQEAFDLLHADLGLAHAKELGPDGQAGGLPLGKGILDWPFYAAALSNSGYTGPWIMHGFLEAEAPSSADFLRRHFLSAPERNL